MRGQAASPQSGAFLSPQHWPTAAGGAGAPEALATTPLPPLPQHPHTPAPSQATSLQPPQERQDEFTVGGCLKPPKTSFGCSVVT